VALNRGRHLYSAGRPSRWTFLVLIKNLYLTKGYGAVRLINEFPAKRWKKSTLNDFIKRLKQTGSITRKSVSSRPRTARKAANIDAVDEVMFSLKQSNFGDASMRKDIIWNICCKLDAFN